MFCLNSTDTVRITDVGRDMKQEIYGKKTNMTHLIFFNKNYNRQLDVFESGLKNIGFSRRY